MLGIIGHMDDAVERYRAASERNDLPALLGTLAPDVGPGVARRPSVIARALRAA